MTVSWSGHLPPGPTGPAPGRIPPGLGAGPRLSAQAVIGIPTLRGWSPGFPVRPGGRFASAGRSRRMHASCHTPGFRTYVRSIPAPTRMFGPRSNAQLDAMAMADNYRTRVESLRDLIELYDREVAMLEGEIHRQLRCHCGYRALPAIDGVGAHHRCRVGGRDRRRRAVPFHRGVVLVAGADPQASPVRHQDDPGVDHQARLPPAAVGADRGRGPRSRRTGLAAGFRRLAQRRGTNKGAGGGGPQGPHARLLRPARRRDPRYRPGPRRRETRTRPDASP
jgi:hypothetical protein